MNHALATSLSALLLTPLSFCQEEFDQKKLDADFVAMMTGTVLEGVYTESGSDKAPQKDSYTIVSCEKIPHHEHDWRIKAKVEYGGKSVTVPIAVEVRWAGDTPMIQLTEMKIPMLGTYSARVAFYGDQYAGFWSGADHGGHMYGQLIRKKKETETALNWSNWRGPNHNGAVSTGEPPTEWSEDKNIVWKADLPGSGSSTPIVWQDRIYLTTAIKTDTEGKPAPKPEPATEPQANDTPRRGRRGRGRGRGRFGRGGFGQATPTKVWEFAVMALNRDSGKVLWKTTIGESVPHEAGHRTASQASNSPVTDGEHIFAHFGSRGLHCLTLDGQLVWSKTFGQMRTRMGFGEGSSPALHGDTLVVNWDHEGQSFITALDKRTGEKLWRKDRNEQTSWSSPLIVEVDGKPQVIVSATRASRAYDLATGEVIWSLSGLTSNCIPTPIHVDGTVYLMSGFRGSALQAIRISGARGDLDESEHVIWTHSKNTPYTPSGVVYDGRVYFTRVNSARFSCLDAMSGEALYEGQQLEGLRTVYSSLVGVNGHVYVSSREGVTKVIKAGDEFQEVATNKLDCEIDASLVVIGDRIYLRGRDKLYCIGQ